MHIMEAIEELFQAPRERNRFLEELDQVRCSMC